MHEIIAPTSTAVPSLAARLNECATRVGGKRALAQSAGLSEAQLFRYINGDSDMTATRAMALAKAAGVDVGWLLTGEGEANTVSPTLRKPDFDRQLLLAVSHALDDVLLEYPHRVPTRLKSSYLAFLYEAFRLESGYMPENGPIARSLIVNVLDFLSGLHDDESLDLYMRYLDAISYGQGDTLNPHEQIVLTQLIIAGNQRMYDGISGEAFFRQLTQNVQSAGAQRLTRMIEDAQTNIGKSLKDVLDLGCANGRDILFLHKLNPSLALHGIEISERGLSNCYALSKSQQVPSGIFHKADMHTLPFADASMDVINARHILYMTPLFQNPESGLKKVMRECARVLRPGGRMYVYNPAGCRSIFAPFTQLLDEQSLQTAILETDLSIQQTTHYSFKNVLGQHNLHQRLPHYMENEIHATLVKA